MKLRTTMLTSALLTLLAVASCSDDSSRKVPPALEGGAAGEAGEPSQAGGNGGNSASGMGSGAGAMSGAAGSDETAGEGDAGGAGGAAPIAAGPLFLFTVDALSTGLPSSGVAASTNPQSVIFASSTANPDPVTGTNVARIGAAELGLADTDTIDAFAAPQEAPTHPVYWFSVAAGLEGAEGERPTRLTRSSQDHEALGDVYFSDGTLSFRSFGDGGDQLGYNGLVADEQSLGLSPAAPATDTHLDNLTGVQLLPDGQMPSALYFSVDASSVGLPGSAVEATAAADRGCTIFESALDGHNSIAFSCADLGLGTNSDVKALAVYGTPAPSEVLFAVTRNSHGLPNTAVARATSLPDNVFASPLDGTNELRVAGTALGLAVDDRLDALAVIDQAPPAYAYSTTCNLTPAPDTPQGAGLTQFQSAAQLGSELILVEGPAAAAAAAIDSVGAYNVKTCAFVAKSPVAPNALRGHTWAPVPLPGWSAAAPFSKLEYWTLTSDGSGVEQLDSSGALLESFTFVGVASAAYAGFALDYDPVHDHFYAVLAPMTGFDYQRLYFPHPPAGAPAGIPLDNVQTPIPHPCAYSPELSGVDANGNSVYAQYDAGTHVRVCTLSPTGEFTGLPFTWPLLTQIPNYAVLIPDEALYALLENEAFAIERYARTR